MLLNSLFFNLAFIFCLLSCFVFCVFFNKGFHLFFEFCYNGITFSFVLSFKKIFALILDFVFCFKFFVFCCFLLFGLLCVLTFIFCIFLLLSFAVASVCIYLNLLNFFQNSKFCTSCSWIFLKFFFLRNYRLSVYKYSFRFSSACANRKLFRANTRVYFLVELVFTILSSREWNVIMQNLPPALEALYRLQ